MGFSGAYWVLVVMPLVPLVNYLVYYWVIVRVVSRSRESNNNDSCNNNNNKDIKDNNKIFELVVSSNPIISAKV